MRATRLGVEQAIEMLTWMESYPLPFAATTNLAAAIEHGGQVFWPDSRSGYVPMSMVKPEDQLEDEMVLKIMGFARELSDQIARFRTHAFADIGDFQALLAQKDGLKKGGAKGNITLMSFDGLKKVTVQVADLIEFGPQLQTAKGLIDECLAEWSADSRPEIRTIVTRAFNVDKEGQVNRAELYRLRKWDIADERWHRAMDAITAASRAVGSREYVRFYERDRPDGQWSAVTIDIASAAWATSRLPPALASDPSSSASSSSRARSPS